MTSTATGSARISSPAGSGRDPKRRGAFSSGRNGSPLIPYLFCAPFLLLFLGFVAIPAVYGVWISFHDFDFLMPNHPWVGLQNYVDLFTPESTYFDRFWVAMRNTGFWVIISVPLLVTVPLVLALLLQTKFPGRTFFRAVFFAPYVLGVAVVGLMWRYLLDTSFGLVNTLLGKLGLPAETPWITDQPYAWISLVFLTVWWTVGFNAVVYLAGLTGVPPELHEAAALDGAGVFRRFWHVTMPHLRPVLTFVFVTTILASANMFGQSKLITNGGPADSTLTALMVLTDVGLGQFKMGAASAMSYVLALCLGLISMVNFWIFKER